MNLVELGQPDVARDTGQLNDPVLLGRERAHKAIRWVATLHGNTVVGAWRLFGPTGPKRGTMTDLGRRGEVEDENDGGLAIMDGGKDGKIGWRICW